MLNKFTVTALPDNVVFKVLLLLEEEMGLNP
jgi:hypothetical protein